MKADLDRLERLLEEDDLDAARRVVGSVADPDDAEDVWRLARAFDHLGDDDEAERLFRLAAPRVLDALVDLSLLLDELGREADADRELRAVSAETESAARVLRGRHFRAVEEPDRAIREYERGVELGDETAFRYLAGTLSYVGPADVAEQLYLDAPLGRSPELELDYALFLEELGRLGEAEQRMRALVAQDHVEAERALADHLDNHSSEESQEAIAHYLAALMLGDVKETVTNLGVTWRDAGRPLEAEYALRHAWADGDRLAGRSLGPLLMARGAEAVGEVVRALAEDGDEEIAAAELPELPPFVVPDAWEVEAERLQDLWVRARGGDLPPPRWITLLQAAQLAVLRERSASAAEIDAHLRTARWIA